MIIGVRVSPAPRRDAESNADHGDRNVGPEGNRQILQGITQDNRLRVAV